MRARTGPAPVRVLPELEPQTCSQKHEIVKVSPHARAARHQTCSLAVGMFVISYVSDEG